MKLIFQVGLFFSVFGVNSSSACPGLLPFADSDKAKANIVFEGKAVAYKLIKDRELANVTFEVSKTLKGESKKKWTVSISSNTNTQVPKNLKQFRSCYGNKSEVGVITSSAENTDVRAVVHGVCNPPYILPLPGKKTLDCTF